MRRGRVREGENTVLHVLSEFSVLLEQRRNEYPRIISVMIIKKAVKSLIFYKPVCCFSLLSVVNGIHFGVCAAFR